MILFIWYQLNVTYRVACRVSKQFFSGSKDNIFLESVIIFRQEFMIAMVFLMKKPTKMSEDSHLIRQNRQNGKEEDFNMSFSLKKLEKWKECVIFAPSIAAASSADTKPPCTHGVKLIADILKRRLHTSCLWLTRIWTIRFLMSKIRQPEASTRRIYVHGLFVSVQKAHGSYIRLGVGSVLLILHQRGSPEPESAG